MTFKRTISAVILQRLKQLNVQLFVDESGDVRTFVPSAGSLGRPLPLTDYTLGHEDGAIHELRLLLRSCPELRAALKAEMEREGSSVTVEKAPKLYSTFGPKCPPRLPQSR